MIKFLFLLVILVFIIGCNGSMVVYCNDPLPYKVLNNLTCEELNQRYYNCSCEPAVYKSTCYAIYDHQMNVNWCFNEK